MMNPDNASSRPLEGFLLRYEEEMEQPLVMEDLSQHAIVEMRDRRTPTGAEAAVDQIIDRTERYGGLEEPAVLSTLRAQIQSAEDWKRHAHWAKEAADQWRTLAIDRGRKLERKDEILRTWQGAAVLLFLACVGLGYLLAVAQ